MEDYLVHYLESVGIVEDIRSFSVACEVCGCLEYETLVNEVEIKLNHFAKLPVVACSKCSFIYQNPRFNKEFYSKYYDKYYRLMLFGDSHPEKDFLFDQEQRGEYLYRSLSNYLPQKGRVLDVGCSSGGLMLAFARRGWQVLGTDPDAAYVEYGRQHYGFDIRLTSAEDMKLPTKHFDLIIITGSLEHVFDANCVLNICHNACSSNSLIFIEGRALNYGIQKRFFSHNHRRYLTSHSIELLMLKHGWMPILSTEEPLCGPTRPGGIYVLGQAISPVKDGDLMSKIDSDRRNNIANIRIKLSNLKGIVQ